MTTIEDSCPECNGTADSPDGGRCTACACWYCDEAVPEPMYGDHELIAGRTRLLCQLCADDSHAAAAAQNRNNREEG